MASLQVVLQGCDGTLTIQNLDGEIGKCGGGFCMSLLESAIVAGLVALTSSLLASQQVAELVVEAFSRQASGSFFAVKVVASIISYALLHLIFGSVVLEGMRAKTWLGAPGEEEREKPRPLHSAIGVIVACLPSVLIATASWPSVRAVYGDVLAQERGAPYLLLGGFWLAPVAAICILVLLHRFPSAAKRFNRVAPLAAAFIYICISLLIFAFHVPVWQQVGGTALVLLFLTILVLGVHKLASWRGVLPVVLVFGLALWWTLPTVLRGPTETARWPEEALGFTTKPDNLFRLDEAASAWLDSRLGRWPQRERQPIFIVAAQGGGMYAAYHTAFALARLNDTSCGRFNDHTFAISAVSGGAFGAGVYGALVNSQLAVREGQDACQWQMTDLVRAYFASDFLTPMIVSGLYVDLPLTLAGEGRWLFGRSARALAFEKAISGRFSDLGQHAAAKLFEAPFQGFWRPEAGGPALVFTSTLVNNATPILISPFEDLDPFPARRSISSSKVVGPNPSYWSWVWRDIKLDTLSQMISLTSRFPFVSPPETINWLGSRVHYKLADGGFRR
jgi:hypothetical protein